MEKQLPKLATSPKKITIPKAKIMLDQKPPNLYGKDSMY